MIESIIDKLLLIDYIAILGKVLIALLMLIVGLWAINLLIKGVKAVMIRRGFDKSLQGFLLSLMKWGLRVFLLITIAGQLGIQTTSFAAVLAAASLAIGMALQGSLSNFAGGALIMVFRPFKIGDFIKVQGEQGVVKKIEIFTTTLNTLDNKVIIIPNGMLSNGVITNYSKEDKRRVDLVFGVSYDADIKHTKELLNKILQEHILVLKEPAPVVILSKLNTSSIDFEVRAWVESKDYWTVYSELLEQTKEALDKAGIEIPYPHTVEISKNK